MSLMVAAGLHAPSAGTRLAELRRMGARRLEELVVYQLSVEFRRSVYRIVQECPRAERDLRYRDQLFDATAGVSANIAEGFGRRTRKEFRLFLSYARSSIAEALTRLEDGIDRGYFTPESCKTPITMGRRTAGAIAALQRSLAALDAES